MITLEQAAVGYGEAPPILKRLNFRIEADDRIALLGRNGNGKTTLARLLASQLAPAEGAVNAPGKLKVGYFTQYQVEELAGEDTPLDLMTRAIDKQSQDAVRAQLGRLGFSGPRAQQRVDKLSGGRERGWPQAPRSKRSPRADLRIHKSPEPCGSGLPCPPLREMGRCGATYRSSDSTFCCDWLACASVAVKAKVTLERMLEKPAICDCRQMKTGEKYLVTLWG